MVNRGDREVKMWEYTKVGEAMEVEEFEEGVGPGLPGSHPGGRRCWRWTREQYQGSPGREGDLVSSWRMATSVSGEALLK